MQLLTFHLGDERYAINTRYIVEVVPLVKLTKIPLADPVVAGLLNLRGLPVPVIDLRMLVDQIPVRHLMSTRLILIPLSIESCQRLVAFTAERVTEITQQNTLDTKSVGLNLDRAPFIQGVIFDDQGTIQVLDPLKVLNDYLKQALFTETNQVNTG